MARLDVYQSGTPCVEVSLPETGTLIMGRGPEAHLVLPHPLVSRIHAEIRPTEGGGHVLVDASSNGTRVNGEDVDGARMLHDEDIVEIASYRIFYRVRSVQGGVQVTARQSATPTRILEIKGDQVRAERVWLEGTGSRYELRGQRQIIGKAPESDIPLDDEFISRAHAAIAPVAGGWRIQDLGSTNGVAVNGTQISDASLKPGDEITLGQLKLKFCAELETQSLQPAPEGGCGGLLGNSAGMRELFARVGRVAPTEMPVLIHGETGTGKELLAAALHDQSTRAGRAFVTVNCGAISESLAESELFGHEKGAFTGAAAARKGLFAEADGGTVFLDEVGELSKALQVKLLRVLETGEIRAVGADRPRRVDVRVIAATHRDLAALVREGEFREDLYYRLAVLTLELPPLRARGDDLELLAAHFLNEQKNLSKEALEKLRRHSFSGNVRELRNVIERAAILCESGTLGPDDLYFDSLGGMPSGDFLDRHPELADMSVEEVERELVRGALERAGGVQSEAARRLGIPKSTLSGRIDRLGLRDVLDKLIGRS